MNHEMLQGIEAVIFDLDGSLVDSMWLWHDIDVEYLGRFGIPMPPNLQACIEGMSFQETAVYFKERFALPLSLEEIKADWNRMAWDKYEKEVPLKAGIPEFLKGCERQGIKLGIATSNSRELVENILSVHNLRGLFSCIMTGSEIHRGKPAPDIYLAVAESLHVPPKNCLVFEDIVPGIQAGKAAGMRVCAVEDAYSLSDRARKEALADYYITDYHGLFGQFLPLSRADMEERDWEAVDFAYVIGDAYVDHPSFGSAIISRVLEAKGYRVGIIAQPDWRDEESINLYGRPKLGFLISGGNMDSCVNHYTVSKKRRATDAYTPGGRIGKRPDYATVVYGNLIRKKYPDVPIIIGGIEASLRRLAHYDYWTDSFKRSILLDSQADLISYGMGERSIVEIAEALESGISVRDITFISGTVFRTKDLSGVYDGITLPSYEEMRADKTRYADSFAVQYQNTDSHTGRPLIEAYPNDMYVVQNPPQPPLSTAEMDALYDLPYMRDYHPSYKEQGGIPAISEIKFSLVSNRGCFGGCSFCALTFHQGRTVQARSHESILREADLIRKDPDFKGYIHDVGGPTANFRQPSCEKQLKQGVCQNRQCLFPKVCPNLRADHSDYLALLRKLRALPGVKKVFVRSGIRFDYLLADKDDTFFRELVKHHISGQLKVAPEHVSDAVLKRMGKPENAVYERFVAKYRHFNQTLHKDQFLVPYLMSSHPGSTLKEAVELAEYLRDLGYMPEQVQDFYPTPSTLSTVMYYTGIDPRDGSKVYVCRNPHEKAMQRALIQYRDPKNYELVREALIKAGRTDLIGFDKKCLIRPRQGEGSSKDIRSAKDKENAKYKGNTKDNESTKGKRSTRDRSNINNMRGTRDVQNTQEKRHERSAKKTIRNIHKKKGDTK
ncbi:MAG: YgiQ family radical SAM protein [Candidatus Gastranaerophilales bacterium]|nr:YgiQ family radical SAM protein [Candidatus Gastranaerophilales bacterium]